MARVSVNTPLPLKDEQRLLDKFFLAFSSLGNWQEAEAFLLEFLTEQELVMLAKRLELYKRTQKGEQYKRIMQELKVTGQTVSEARKRMKRMDAYFERVLRKFMALDRRL